MFLGIFKIFSSIRYIFIITIVRFFLDTINIFTLTGIYVIKNVWDKNISYGVYLPVAGYELLYVIWSYLAISIISVWLIENDKIYRVKAFFVIALSFTFLGFYGIEHLASNESLYLWAGIVSYSSVIFTFFKWWIPKNTTMAK